MRLITIGRTLQFQTQVSDQHYDYLMQWLWTYAYSHPKGSLVYARRSIRQGGMNVTILMHREIMRLRGLEPPSPKHTVDHDDGHSLNNQDENLFWRTPKQQMAKQMGIQCFPVGYHRGAGA